MTLSSIDLFDITRYPTLYDIDRLFPTQMSWVELSILFTTHLVTEDKLTLSGFGPYRTRQPVSPCRRHSDGKVRPGPHRCDDCVRAVTLCVFDADVGTPAQVKACQDALDAHGLAHVWYSTHSHRPGAPIASYRLVVPLAVPVHPSRWKEVRAAVLERYRVPADPAKCSGASHFYFLPSHPPGVEPQTYVGTGSKLLDPRELGLSDTATPAPKPTTDVALETIHPPGPVDLAPLIKKLRAVATGYRRSGGTKDLERAALLQKIIDGAPLAEHGSRNAVTFRAAGILTWTLPHVELGVLKLLLTPSVEAMRRAGSRLTWAKVDRFLTSGRTNYLKAQAQLDSQVRLFEK